jgi:uncharacterized protein YneF (UPF0154 family)
MKRGIIIAVILGLITGLFIGMYLAKAGYFK